MILYFTGTGNSQYAAEYLNAIFKKDLVSINQCMKKGEYPEFKTEENFIFVLPTYAWRIPRTVEAFMRKCSFFYDHYQLSNRSIGNGSHFHILFHTGSFQKDTDGRWRHPDRFLWCGCSW